MSFAALRKCIVAYPIFRGLFYCFQTLFHAQRSYMVSLHPFPAHNRQFAASTWQWCRIFASVGYPPEIPPTQKAVCRRKQHSQHLKRFQMQGCFTAFWRQCWAFVAHRVLCSPLRWFHDGLQCHVCKCVCQLWGSNPRAVACSGS